jgi:hypothetical protein
MTLLLVYLALQLPFGIALGWSSAPSAEPVQVSETNAIMQYRIAEIGHWYEPDKLMGYFVAVHWFGTRL